MHGTDLFKDTLLLAARQQNPCAVAITIAAIMQFGGHTGLIQALEILTDEARRNVPPPVPGMHYDCHVFAVPNGAPGEVELPAAAYWSLSMLEARINSDDHRLRCLVDEVIAEPDFPDYVVSLALLAGQPDETISVVQW